MKNKGLFFPASILLCLISGVGLIYSIFLIINSFKIQENPSEAIINLVTSLGMDLSDGVSALRFFGGIFFIVFLIMFFLSLVSILFRNKMLKKKTLIYIALTLLILFIIFLVLGLFDLSYGLLIVLILGFYIFCAYVKYLKDSN